MNSKNTKLYRVFHVLKTEKMQKIYSICGINFSGLKFRLKGGVSGGLLSVQFSLLSWSFLEDLAE